MRAHWADWLGFAVHRLGLSPSAFWSLSLAEWLALVRPAARKADLPDMAALKALDDRFSG